MQGIKCTIKLECKIDDAPLQIIKSYKHLNNDLFKIDANANDIMEQIESNTNIEEVYAFDLGLEINLSTKKPDILELHFNHNNKN